MMPQSEDNELQTLLSLNQAGLTDLLADDFAMVRAAARDEEARQLAYLDDLREVARLSSGAGVRVLRHWLDAASANDRLLRTDAPAGAVYAATALYDYARDRMAEVALSDPVSLVRMQLEGARRWARENLPPCGEEREAAPPAP